MARTRLFSMARRALIEAGAGETPRAISRRAALLFGGAAALSACATLDALNPFKPAPASPASAPPVENDASRIAIVGGGVAGLTCAYRLARAGRRVVLYEASNRFGGRMFTKKNFNAEGMFCELGGELVDSNHKPLIDLARELGVGIQRLKPAHGGGEDLYYVGGRLHAEHELLHRGKGAFLPIARKIAHDHARLTDAGGEWTEHARALDRMSVAQYLAQFRGHAPAWVIDLLDLAYWGEYGLPTEQQSSLNLVDFIGSDTKRDFEMFGESDEAYRIEGGSSSLPDVLFARLGEGVAARPGHTLDAIARDGNSIQLALTSGGMRFFARHEIVVLALPFTKLREVRGIDGLGLDGKKLQCIRELGYGDNAKVMIGTTSRPWTGAAHLPVKSDGEFYAREFQVAWDTSRGQSGTRGILTNYLSGVEDQAVALAGLRTGLEKISPAIAASLDESNMASFFWARYPFNKGSFVAAKVGQYTTLLEVAGTPELGGRLQFAGEHTSADYAGFMCGGVDSGEWAAAAVLALPARTDAALPRAA